MSEARDELVTTALDVSDLAKVVADVGLDPLLDELIERLGSAIAGYDAGSVEDRVRAGFDYERPELGLVEWMPSHRVGSTVAVKTVGYHPDNPTQRGLPSVMSTTALYDTTRGHMFLLCESTFLTAMRTGAASALVTDALTPPGPLRVGLVGAGAQAVTQLHAISRLRPIRAVVVTDVDESVAASFVDRLPITVDRIEVVSAAGFEAALPDLDVVCTCTSVEPRSGPVAALTDAKPALHVNAVGADFPGKTELPAEFLRESVVVTDVAEQCLVEGESQRLDREDLGPTMVDVLAGRASSDLAGVRTVFDSTGWSFEDLVAAELFAEHAARLGLGTRLALTHVPTDPYDPYEVLRG